MDMFSSFNEMFNATVLNRWHGNLPTPCFDGPIKFYSDAQINRMSAEELEEQIERNRRIILYLEGMLLCSPPDSLWDKFSRYVEKKEHELDWCQRSLDVIKAEQALDAKKAES